MSYPSKIESLVDVTSGQTLAAGGHAARHNDVNAALVELADVLTVPAADTLAFVPNGVTERMRIDTAGLITGTGTSLGAWTAYTPTVTAQTGTLTTASATGAYCQIGKTVFARVAVTITTNGTGAGSLNFSLPITCSGSGENTASGREQFVTGNQLQVILGTTIANVWTYNNAYPAGDNRLLTCSMVYQAA